MTPGVGKKLSGLPNSRQLSLCQRFANKSSLKGLAEMDFQAITPRNPTQPCTYAGVFRRSHGVSLPNIHTSAHTHTLTSHPPYAAFHRSLAADTADSVRHGLYLTLECLE